MLFHSSQSAGVAPIMWCVCLGRGAGVDTQGFSVPLSCARSRVTASCWKKAAFRLLKLIFDGHLGCEESLFIGACNEIGLLIRML